MTFEEWLEKEYPSLYSDRNMLGIKDWVDFANACWNAAKEDSKPIVKAYFQEAFHGGLDFSHWLLSPLKPGDKQWHFPCKEDAEKWAIENGYRVEDN